ncbi:hypothetical protein, partial [Staphylococcus condimenti]|uniref:hypothetical protein n=1 Tax=Staphylococcus condimenti TaxID=70255 RepID=UPI00197E2591
MCIRDSSNTVSFIYESSILMEACGEQEKQQCAHAALHLETKFIDTLLLYIVIIPLKLNKRRAGSPFI